MDITAVRGLYTQKTIAKYDEMIPEANFLQSLFKVDTTAALDVSIEIRRGSKYLAVEVQRGGASNGNDFTKSSLKMFRPPMYSEDFVANHMTAYNIPFGSGVVTPETVSRATMESARKLGMLRTKISRAKEKQCSEVLFDGTVTTKFNDVIDYARSASSKVDLSGLGGYWNTVTTDVETQLVGGAEFIRNTGNSSATQFDLLMSGEQFIALKKTNFYKDDANRDAKAQLQDINRPIARAGGANYHGTLNAGAYIFHIWTYDAVYTNDSEAEVRFTPNNKTLMMPIQETGLILAHGGVPVIGANGMPVAKKGEYIVRDFVDRKEVSHTWFVESAPLATCHIPDRFYTMQTLGIGGGQG